MASRINFSEALQLAADGGERLRFLGEAAYLCLYRGELDQAQAIFEGLTDLAPGDPVGHLGLAEVHLAHRAPRKAEAAARRAGEVAGNSADTMALAYELQGKALLFLDRTKEAEEVLQRAIEVAPDSPAADSARKLPELFSEMRAAISEAERNDTSGSQENE